MTAQRRPELAVLAALTLSLLTAVGAEAAIKTRTVIVLPYAAVDLGREEQWIGEGIAQSLTIGLQHPELFHWVMGFSSAAPEGDLTALFPQAVKAAEFNKASKLLWIGVGKDDFLLKRNQAFDKWLTDTGVTHTYMETAGAHNWLVWRDYLQQMLPKLFR